MKSKPHRQGDRQIDFFKCRVVIFLCSFFVEGELLNLINCNPDVGMCWPMGEVAASDEASVWVKALELPSV